MKLSEKIGNGQVNKRLNSGGNPDYVTLVRHALAEVCTVPVLLVITITIRYVTLYLRAPKTDFSNFTFTFHICGLQNFIYKYGEISRMCSGSLPKFDQLFCVSQST